MVACWADQGLHLRGTIEGFKRISSEQKWLEVHGRKKWAYYYTPDCVKKLQEFFDHFLKGEDTPVNSWPRVRLELREAYFKGDMQAENEWPIARTQYTRLYLDARTGSMQHDPLPDNTSVRYSALGSGPGAHRAVFEITFREQTDLIGHMNLKLYIEAEQADDMDIFAGVYKFDSSGNFVPMAFYSFFDDGPVALGWLRASHRELDETLSTEYQPVHTHKRELKLKAGEIVPIEIELWPSGTRFEAGDRLRLIIQGTELQKYSKITDPIYYRHEDTVNNGHHIIHTGGEYESFLLVPKVGVGPR